MFNIIIFNDTVIMFSVLLTQVDYSQLSSYFFYVRRHFSNKHVP